MPLIDCIQVFDWNTLPTDALVVDVGGGLGFSCKTILKAYPKLRCIVQDIPTVIDDGIKVSATYLYS